MAAAVQMPVQASSSPIDTGKTTQIPEPPTWERVSYPCEAVFGKVGKGLGLMPNDVVEGIQWNKAHKFQELIPEIDPNYVFRREILREVLAGLRLKSHGIYCFGETGGGKTTVQEQIAARLQIPLFSAIASEDMDIRELISQLSVVDKQTKHQPGIILLAMKLGFWIRIDEFDSLPSTTGIALNQILDRQAFVTPDGKTTVRPHSGFRLLATGNTIGDGRDDRYPGTQRVNMATLDRFLKTLVNYPTREEEIRILMEAAQPLPLKVAEKLVTLGQKVRDAHNDAPGKDKNATSNVTLSTRNLIAIAQLANEFKNLHTEDKKNLPRQERQPYFRAFKCLVLNQANTESRISLLRYFNDLFGGQQLNDDATA